jgi:membrane protein
MGAATAFFAFFALPAINIILNHVLRIVFGENQIQINGKLFEELSQVFGNRSAHQIEDISQNLQHIPLHPLFTFVSFIFLLLSATTLFAVVKGSLNQLWNIKDKAKGNHAKFIKDRAIGLSMILFSGFLFITSLFSDLLLAELKVHLTLLSTPYQAAVMSTLNHVVSLVIFTLWFALLFKYLPDIMIRWKAIFIGAFVTAMLYKIGAFILEVVLIEGQVSTVFGTAASIVLILLFIFYASLIFYYGAAFTKTYAYFARLSPQPTSHATAYEITEIDIVTKAT